MPTKVKRRAEDALDHIVEEGKRRLSKIAKRARGAATPATKSEPEALTNGHHSTADEASDSEPVKAEAQKTKRKRKTKEEKAKEAMPLAARTQGLRMFIGAHVSGAGGTSYALEKGGISTNVLF